MTDKNLIAEKEARLLAEKEAMKYGFGQGEINAVLEQCGKDLVCIRNKFQELSNSKKIQDAVKAFQQGNDGLEPS